MRLGRYVAVRRRLDPALEYGSGRLMGLYFGPVGQTWLMCGSRAGPTGMTSGIIPG